MAEHVCPVWAGYLMASPVRKLMQNPRKILGPYVDSGMRVLDAGCAMGFFSLPLARMVGPNGKVICVDMQKKMLKALQRRARKAGLLDRIEVRTCQRESLGLEDLGGQVDFALAFAVVHEVPDDSAFFLQVSLAMKRNGKCMVAEPKGRVSEEDFARSISVARNNGFTVLERPRIRGSRAVVLEKR